MTAVVGRKVLTNVRVVIGVDTHQDQHVAVAIDHRGCAWPSATRPRLHAGMALWNGGPGVWDRFAPSESKAPVPMAPDSRGI